MTTKKEMIPFINTAKGVCIMLVVILHLDIDLGFHPVDALRMPLYFVLCGLFFKDYGGIRNLILHKTNKLLIPFLFFNLVPIIVYYGMKLVWGEMDQFRGWDLITIVTAPGFMIGPIWFLICLFWMNIIFFATQQLPRHWMRLAAVMACGLGGYALGEYDIYLPLHIAPAFTCLPFFYLGAALKKSPLLYPGKFDKWLLPVAALLIAISYMMPPTQSAFVFNRFDSNIVTMYLSGACIVLGFLLLCKKIGKVPVITWFGRYSIVVLCFHTVVMQLLEKIISTLFPSVEVNAWIYFVMTMAICAGLIPICRKYLPYVTAQKPLIKLPVRSA
jgi:fucose 4-O-acetylase-like acetyltransferase